MKWKSDAVAIGARIMVVVMLLLSTSPQNATGGPGDEDALAGTLFLQGEDGVSRPAVALETDVAILVSGLVARVTVRQKFRNESDLWLEGVYLFPLPELAAVDRMVLEVGERRIEGRIQERTQAKRAYEKAKKDGHTASLLEQERPNLFTTSVANIAPGESVEIKFEYQQTLHYEKGSFELRFPMTLTARYAPGAYTNPEHPQTLEAPDRTGWSRPVEDVPDARRITTPTLHPGGPIVNPLWLEVDLEPGFPIGPLTSPSHALQHEQVGEHHHRVWINGVPADRDFVLRWAPVLGRAPRAAIFSEEWGGEHYALILILPPEAGETARRLPREAIYVIDTSGSMGGASMDQARAALLLALEHLTANDSFNVISFDDAPESLFPTSRPATQENLHEARRFVRRLQASGGTEMLAALTRALHDPSREEDRLRQVVFITDGSIANEAQLFATIQRDLGRSRLFMVGIGSAPNSFFLNRAAAFGRGTATSIGTQDEVRSQMTTLFKKIESPVLSDLELKWNDPVEAWPAHLPDLYAGEPVVVVARLQRFVGEVRVLGRRGERAFDVRLPLTQGAHERGIHKLWARRKIAHWMNQGTAGIDATRVRKEVLAVALGHELVSRFTSLVAVDVTPRRPKSAAGAGTRLPNHGPKGFDAKLIPGVLPQGATPAPLLLWLGSVALLLATGLWHTGRKTA